METLWTAIEFFVTVYQVIGLLAVFSSAGLRAMDETDRKPTHSRSIRKIARKKRGK